MHFFVKRIEWSLEVGHPNYQHYPKWNHRFTWPVQTMSELISLHLTSGEYSDQRWWLREVDWLRLCQGHRTSHLHFVWNSRLSALTENRVVGRKNIYIYIWQCGSRLPNIGTWIEGAGEREREIYDNVWKYICIGCQLALFLGSSAKPNLL